MTRRASQTSSSEESYVSPKVHQAPPPGPLTPSISPDGRSRRTRGSSSDDDPTVGDMVNEDYRAGGPFLAPVPCLTSPMSLDNPATVLWRSDPSFVHAILDILRKHRVEVKYVELFGRQSAKYYGDVFDTVIVTASKTQLDNSWISACFDIRDLFLQKNLSNLNIEIVDNRASTKEFTSPVSPVHPIYFRWDDVLKQVIDKIGHEGWLALECFRWGEEHLEGSTGGEIPVTIILTIPRDSGKDWKPAREKIVSVLANFELHDVAVAILRGEIWRGSALANAVPPDDAWENQSQLGMSIGPSHPDSSASTLGPIVEIQSPDGKWMRLGLTCWHSVISTEKDQNSSSPRRKDRERWDRYGMAPNDENAADLKVVQPALRDYEDQMEILEQDDKDLRNDERFYRIENDINLGNLVCSSDELYHKRRFKEKEERRQLRERLQDFFPTKAYLGQVFSASGSRKTEGNTPSQLYWALIGIQEARMGKNELPPFENQMLSAPDREIQDGEKLFKIGRTTTLTQGKYSGLRSVIQPSGEVNHIPEPKSHKTTENVIMGLHGKPFAERGDSGAAIFDLAGCFAGLLFGGNDQTGATYFTPWPTLVADIKKITGASDVRIPED